MLVITTERAEKRKNIYEPFRVLFYSVSLYDNYVVCDSHGRGRESTANREKHIKLFCGAGSLKSHSALQVEI